MAVAVDIPPFITSSDNSIVMYAHGERYLAPELHFGQEFPREFIRSQLYCPQNEQGDWVPGLLQIDQSTMVFALSIRGGSF
jgi:hypothetical protein